MEQISIIKKYGPGINKSSFPVVLEKKNRSKKDHQLTIDESLMLNYFKSDVYRMDKFKEYLDFTARSFFTVLFSDGTYNVVDYKHRWTKSYQKGIISKFYKLNAWFHRHGLQVGMLSLTTAQTGYSDIEILQRLKYGWDRFQDNLNKRGYQCFKLFEMHDTSGLPHIHVMLIGDLDEKYINDLRSLWVDKYEMGDNIIDKEGQDHSFAFTLSKNGVNNITNYLMSYLRKNIVDEIINNDKALRFHSLFWETKTRLFSCSRYLSYVMRKVNFSGSNNVFSIMCNNKTIYNKSESKAFACKYQQIDGCRYKYKLFLFEQKNKKNIVEYDIMYNYTVNKIFKYWGVEYGF